MHVRTDALVRPATGSLSATFEIADYPEGVWLLHDGLQIGRLEVDGVPSSYVRLKEGPPSPFSDNVNPVQVARYGKRMRVEVSGVMGDVAAEVNQIAPEHVELAAYSGWHPLFPSFPAFSFDAAVEVAWDPATADGRDVLLAGSAEPGKDGRWHSASSIDIPIFASRSLEQVPSPSGSLRVWGRAGARSLPEVQHTCAAAIEDYTARWGTPGGAEVTVVVSPRDGWPYVRFPVILLPESGDLAGDGPLGTQIVRHEVAHLWWHSAPASSDWLNEGVAEYAALSTKVECEGTQPVLHRLREGLIGHRDDPASAETAAGSEEARRCLYMRPAYALLVAEQMTSREAIDALLREWRALPEAGLRTETALLMADGLLPRPAADYLRMAITTPGWVPER